MTFITLSIALAFIVFVGVLIRRRRMETNAAVFYRRLQPIYLPALLNLLNPEDIDFLRNNLRHSDFMIVKRDRTRALIQYVRRIAANARVLVTIGVLSRQTTCKEVAVAAQTLVSRALVTRILALRTLACLYVELVLPLFDTNLGSTIQAYEAAQARLEGMPSVNLGLR